MARSKIAVFAAIIFFACMALYSAWNDLRSDQRQLDDATLVIVRVFVVEDPPRHLGGAHAGAVRDL